MLIDGLLPTTVAAAVARPIAAPVAIPICSATAGAPQPQKGAPSLPSRHCALCTLCLACAPGLLPPRYNGVLADRLLADDARLPAPLATPAPPLRVSYDAARPRAPPRALS